MVELRDGRLLAFGRGDTINGNMPMSVSSNLGKTWTIQGQPVSSDRQWPALSLQRLREGPLLFIAFTSGNRREPEANGMTFVNQAGREFTGHGMYAAVSFDDGQTWPRQTANSW